MCISSALICRLLGYHRYVRHFLYDIHGVVLETSSFWEWPTIGRDIVFIAIMYGEICVTVAGAYVLSFVRTHVIGGGQS